MSKALMQLKDAVRADDIEAVKQLLQKGVDPNEFDAFCDNTPLSLACLREQLDIIKLLLEKLESAPVHLQKKIYYDSLKKVVFSTYKDKSVQVAKVKMLLYLPVTAENSVSKLESLKSTWSDSSLANELVNSAVENDNAEVARLLLQRFEYNDNIVYLVSQACKQRNTGLVAVLLDNTSGCVDDLTEVGEWSLLMNASKGGHNEIIELLLENRADIDFQDQMGESTALMVAAGMGRVETVKLLLEKGASVDITNWEGKTALLETKSDIEIIKMLVAKNADINKCDDSGKSAVTNAVVNKSLEAVQLLLAYKAKVTDGTGTPLLNRAIWNQRLALRGEPYYNKIPKLLLQYGAPVNVQDERSGDSPLIAACKKVNAEMCRLLLDKGADVKLFDRNGACALLHAARKAADPEIRPQTAKKILEIIEMLVNHDKDSLYIPDHNEEKAVDVLPSGYKKLYPKRFFELNQQLFPSKVISSDDQMVVSPNRSFDQTATVNGAQSSMAKLSLSPARSEQPAAKKRRISSSLPSPELAQTSPDSSVGPPPSTSTPTSADAHQRKFNLVLYGVAESTGTSRHQRVRDDHESATSTLSKILHTFSRDSICDCTRMGKYSPGKTRPLLVKLVRAYDASYILHSLKDLTPEDLDGVAVKRHMSPTERQAESILLKKRWELAQSGLNKEHLKIRGNKLFQDSAPIGEVVGGIYKPISTSN